MNTSTKAIICLTVVAVVVISGIAIADAVKKHEEQTAQVELTITKVYLATTWLDGTEVYSIEYETTNVFKSYVVDFYADGHYLVSSSFSPVSPAHLSVNIVAPPVVPTIDNVHFIIKLE